ncbi:unnamed protein product [Oncorhynchus mykiss]|uniref:VPS10 domain-containing protein n=1 Tax=Oncorhynchus mykiss TaxID=8022 RepID=A0A060WBQ6_ONCMY|nr:unnamed protein product [Oncorhynchus mykiss]
MNDKVGSKTVLSYLYVCPSNKRKIMVLTDPEFESSVLISSDEGASYQKYRLSFYILSLLFHPTQEDWALAYSHDQKLYASLDFGRKWQLVHEHVNRFYWSVTGLDKESDLVHMEAHTPNGRIQYVTCRALTCSEPNRNYPFPGYIDISSLVVQDDYMFIQVTTAGQASYYVSYQRDPFLKIKLPKYSLPKDLHIVSTDEHQVFAAVQEWNQNDTYNLYLSDTQGILFTLAMENVKTTRGLGGNQMLDLYEPFCSLHLQLQTSENPYLSGSISTKASAPGIIVATGNIGSELSYNNVGMFISSDAGNNWRHIFEEEHNVWFLDKGGALVAVKQPTVPTRHLQISFDEGRQWTRHSFSLVPLFVDGMLVEAGTENQIMTTVHCQQVSDFPEDQLLVAVFPGVPTAAELFLLPHKNQSEGRKKSEEELEQISEILASALNQNLVEFELKPGARVIVYITQLTLAPLVDSMPRHSSSAMLMLLSVVFLGLAVFLIYKFKRKIPWINIYAEVNQEKEQEMIGSVSQSDSTPKITLSEFSTAKEVMEKEMDARVKRRIGHACESTREIPNCTSV